MMVIVVVVGVIVVILGFVEVDGMQLGIVGDVEGLKLLLVLVVMMVMVVILVQVGRERGLSRRCGGGRSSRSSRSSSRSSKPQASLEIMIMMVVRLELLTQGAKACLGRQQLIHPINRHRQEAARRRHVFAYVEAAVRRYERRLRRLGINVIVTMQGLLSPRLVVLLLVVVKSRQPAGPSVRHHILRRLLQRREAAR